MTINKRHHYVDGSGGKHVLIRVYGGGELLVPLADVTPWKDLRRPATVFGKILCAIGIHRWEKKIPRRGLMRENFSFFFFTHATQEGLQCCARKGCDVKRRVTRSAVLGADTDESAKWETVS